MLQKQLRSALQRASKAEGDAAATAAELAHARDGLRAALDAQQAALEKQKEVDAQLCSIRVERDAVAVHVAERQKEQELAQAKEKICHLAAQLEEEQQWRAEAEGILWEYGLVAPEFERHSEALSLLTRPRSPPPVPSTPPIFENKAAIPRLPVQQLLSRLRCMRK
ncbi:g2822 [Coccomyxa elongata]